MVNLKSIQLFKNLMGNRYSKEFFCLIAVSLFASITILPIPLTGIPSGYDLHQHFQFALTFHDSILSGDLFPSWSAYENYGFGGIGIRFYPPLPYYVLAFARIFAGNWYDAAWLTFLFWMIMGCIGVYIWAREWLTPTEAVLAASMYSLVPYHLTQIYQAFLYAEFAGSAMLPFCFAFLTRICRRRKAKDVFFLAISFALLILTNTPATIIGSISLGVYAIATLNWRKWSETVPKLVASFGLGLLAAAFYWSKLVSETSWLNHAKADYSSGIYDYRNSFLPHLFTSFPKSITEVVYLDQVFILTLILLLPLLLHLFLNRKFPDVENRNIFRGLVITGLFSFLMTMSVSSFLWQTLPILYKVQAPWRWFSVASLFGAVSFVTGVLYLFRRGKKYKSAIKYSLLLILLSISIFNLTQSILMSAPLSRQVFEAKLSNLLHEESFKGWWTIWAARGAFENKENVAASSRTVEIRSWQPEQREFTVQQGQPATGRVATFYYPHWKAAVNGQLVAIDCAEDGTILIPLSAEKADIKLYFQETLLVRIAEVASIVAWLIIIAGFFCTTVLRLPFSKKMVVNGL